MGKQLVSQYNGQCKECDTKYLKGDTIFWDGVKKINCKDYACFTEQGGELTAKPGEWSPRPKAGAPRVKSTYSDRLMTADESLDINLDIDVTDLGTGATLLEYIREANTLTKRLYPNLKANTQTFGQIRNSIVAHLITLNKG